MKNKNIDISNFVGILAIISIICTTAVVIASLGYEDKPEYDRDGIQIYYVNGSDNIQVINNGNEVAYITIGDSEYKVSNTNGNKVTLGLNSKYGKVDININGDILTVNYEEPYEDD